MYVILPYSRSNVYHPYVQALDCRACIYVAAETGSTKRQGFRTVYGCADCAPNVPLHPGACFELYHEKVAQGKWKAYVPRKPIKKKKKTRSGKRKDRSE